MHVTRPTYLTPRPSSLRGAHVALHPVRARDLAELATIPDDDAWRLLLRPPAGPGVSAQAWLDDALRQVRRGTERCWLVRDRETGQLLGSTRFLNMDLANRRLEIGSTWLLAEARGTVANAESKLLLLDHAFHDLGVRRVHIQADVRNTRSRHAIERLGATYEGVLRSHIVLPDGSSRDTAVYSILDSDWQELRPRLLMRAAGRGPDWRTRHATLLPLTALGASGARGAQQVVDRREALVAEVDREVIDVELDVLAADVG
ncbi:MAG: acetyltransferase [Thermoleophilia bacterium]|nr:acetyltransferase [Thermoleophilia bacterium]